MIKLFLIQNYKFNIMKFYFYLLIVLQVIIISVSTLPSEDLWNKTLRYISEGKMKSFRYYFIFDEENYTALNINSTEMNSLYSKQNDLYNKYSLRTFLFICKKLDRTIEDAYSIRNNIRDHLINYGVYINNTVFVLISVETIESILYTGSLIKKSYISDNDSVTLNNEIKENIKDKEYYEALENFLIDIEEYFLKKNINKGKSKNSIYFFNNHKSDDLSTVFEIIFPILIIVGLIFCCCCCKKKKIYKSKNNSASKNIYNHDSNSSIGSYGGGGNNISIGGNSYSAPSYSAPSYGGNSIGGASGGAI